MIYPFPSSVMCYWGEYLCHCPSAVSIAVPAAVKHLALMYPQIHSDTILLSAVEFSCGVDTEPVGAVLLPYEGGLHSTFWDGACCLGIVEGYFFSRLLCLQKPCEIKVRI